ncbi:MAG TPA: hypothetical protein VID95_07030, partial [Candidatus Limnocylindrales bacterium]
APAEEAAPAKKPRARKAVAASTNGTEAAVAASSSNGTAPDAAAEPTAETEKKTRNRKVAAKEVAK